MNITTDSLTSHAASVAPRALPIRNQKSKIRHLRRRGLSMVELLIALAISAMLLTATMVALDASFKAYADSAEQASSQAATRMITHRLLAMIRTSTAHGPLEPDAAAVPPVTITGDTLSSNYVELIDNKGYLIRVEYDADKQELWITSTPPVGTSLSEPLIGGVTACTFHNERRVNEEGLYVLARTTIDLTVQPGEDATLNLENGAATPIRVVASTMPRRVE
ncbi:MAG: prepilin-type N-terminal cleavage/methylation domain-containing protein [Phycisphaeraceae bacterium]